MNIKAAVVVATFVIANISTGSVLAQSFDENGLVSHFYSKRTSNYPETIREQWIQPANQTEKCELVWPGKDVPTSAKWFGDCYEGKASGVGIAVVRGSQPLGSSGTETMIGLVVDYAGKTKDDVVLYRQIIKGDGFSSIVTGEILPHEIALQRLDAVKSAAGHMHLTEKRMFCEFNECITRETHPMTGTINYTLSGTSNYQVTWSEIRAENQALYSRRLLQIDGALRAEKYIVDGVPYDIGVDLLSGATGLVAFSGSLNTILAMPFDRYAKASQEIDQAIGTSDAKFSIVQARLCGSSKDVDVQLICNPSKLLPTEADLAEGKREMELAARTQHQQLREIAASINASAAQRAAAQEEMRRRQEQTRLVQEQERRQALQRGIQTVNQIGQAAQRTGQQMLNQSQGYGVPKVEQPTLSRPPVAHCRTIGYITTCN